MNRSFLLGALFLAPVLAWGQLQASDVREMAPEKDVAATGANDQQVEGDKPPEVLAPMPETPKQDWLEEGRASWYGGKRWHGRRTASGERMSRYVLTAAHRSLPLGTWVYVHNLANGRTVRLRINDRGPYVDRFMLDVSEAAAKALGFLRDGHAPVRIYPDKYKAEH